MSQFLLEGRVDNRDEIILDLQNEKRELELENSRLSAEVAGLRAENKRAISKLRRVLTPLYEGMRELFGEMDAISGGGEEVSAPKNTAVWQAWKSRLGTTASKCIDALLTHGELNTQQMAIATGLHRTTIPQGIHALNKAGLINKNSGRFSLKEL